MSRWGVSVQPAAGPKIRGWNAAVHAPRLRGWRTGQVSWPDPVPGQYSDRVGICTKFGTTDYGLGGNLTAARTEAQAIAADGFRWIRDDFSWQRIEATQGVYDWTIPDVMMRVVAENGLKLSATIAYSAPWASSDSGGDYHYPPATTSSYAGFCTKLAQRYGTGGTFWTANPDLVPTPPAALELWNEPFSWYFWRPTPDPTAYAALCRAAITAIRAVDPAIKILAYGEVFQARSDLSSVAWCANLLAADPGLFALIDAAIVHTYPATNDLDPYDDSQTYSAGFIRSAVPADLIKSVTGVDLPIWMTEFGYHNATSVTGGVSEALAATYTRSALLRGLNDFGPTTYRAGIARMFCYSRFRSNGVMTDSEGNYGLLHTDGTPKPAYTVLKSFAAS